jgi:copper resistance protein C
MARWEGAGTRAGVPVVALMTSLLVHGGMLAAGALAVAAVAGPAPPAAAHARVTGSSPADGAVVAAPPAEVRLVLDAKPATVEGDPLQVYGPDGRRVDAGGTRVSADARTLTVALDATYGLPAGEYQLMYRVVSADTHIISGRLTFTAEQAAAAAPSSELSTGDPRQAVAAAVGGPPAGDAPLDPAGDATALADQPPSGRSSGEPRLSPGRPDDVRPRVAAGAVAAVALVGIGWRLLRRRSRRRFEAELAPPPLPALRRTEPPPRRRGGGSTGPARPATRPATAPLGWVSERYARDAPVGAGHRRAHGRSTGAPQRRRATR